MSIVEMYFFFPNKLYTNKQSQMRKSLSLKNKHKNLLLSIFFRIKEACFLEIV